MTATDRKGRRPRRPRRPDQMMNPARAAELLGVAYQTVANAIANGTIAAVPYEVAGGRVQWLLTVQAVRDWRDATARRYEAPGTESGMARAGEIRAAVV